MKASSDDCIPFGNIQGSTIPDSEEDRLNTEIEKSHDVALRSYHNKFSKRSKWNLIGIFLVSLLVLLLIIFIFLWVKQKYELGNSPCLTPICIQLASGVLQMMDTKLDPCEDFYQFSCNGFLQNTLMPNDEYSWSSTRQLMIKVDHYLKKLYEKPSSSSDSIGFKLLQTFYRSCINKTKVDSLGFQPVFEKINKLFGGWALLPPSSPGARTDNGYMLTTTSFNLTNLYFPLYQLFSYSHLAFISVEHDPWNVSRYVIEVDQPKTPVSRLVYLNESLPHIVTLKEAYFNFMTNYSKLIGVPDSSLFELNDIFEFETEIARRKREQRDEKTFLLLKLDELCKLCPIFDWKLLLQEMFSRVNYTVHGDEIIHLPEKEYLVQRCDLVEEYTKTDEGIRKLHNAAVWSLLFQTNDYMPSEVQMIKNDYNKHKFGLEQAQPRWLHCVSITPEIFQSTLGQHFAHDQFAESTKISVAKMVEEIKETFKENFDSVNWMMEEDKMKAIEKVDRMHAYIGYPEDDVDKVLEVELNKLKDTIHEDFFFENMLSSISAAVTHQLSKINSNKVSWALPPYVVNAFYHEGVNSIYFPAGILQSPIYDTKQPESFNYGGIGMVVGHEITHAFDSNGAKRDAAGNLRRWWSNETVIAFEERSQCMIDQYNNYNFDNISLNGRQTLGENIADNGGMKAAYTSFMKLPDSKRNIVLPGLSYNPEQLFFIAFAQSWCTKSLNAAVIQNVIYDVHTIAEYRVTGSLQNLDEFAYAFKCPLGTPMNPPKKCKIW